MQSKVPEFVHNDPWLQSYQDAINNRIEAAKRKEAELTGDGSLNSFASGHLYFGLHKTEDGWAMREWAPNATHIYLIGSFNNWEEQQKYEFRSKGHGVWELLLSAGDLKHGDLYALSMHWAVD